jgi:type I restriction enzyme, S subunit
MSEWIHSNVGAVTAYQRAGGTPTATTDAYYGGEIPFVTIEDITNGTRYLDTTVKNLSELGLRTSAAWLIKEPHILYSMYATVGKPIINRIACATNQAIIALKESDAIEQKFLFYQLLFIRPQVYKFTSQTTQSNLNASSVRKLPIAYPRSKETQRKIATILSTIDTAIEQTEALIEKYQHIKAGLMHDLFTRGVLPNGQLRPPREKAPELYQETSIGWIPNDWMFTTCDAVCEQIIDCKNRTPPETPDGHPVIRTPNVRYGEFVDKELLFTDAHSYAIWTARGKPKVGDVVITREAPVGEVCKIPERHPEACLGQRMMLYRPNEKLIDPDFFLFALQSRQIQNRLDLISGGSTVGHVRVGDIRSLWVLMPEAKNEQHEIAKTLSQATERIRSEQARRNKLQTQKLGLMQDLLTGKVQVKLDQEGVEVASG